MQDFCIKVTYTSCEMSRGQLDGLKNGVVLCVCFITTKVMMFTFADSGTYSKYKSLVLCVPPGLIFMKYVINF